MAAFVHSFTELIPSEIKCNSYQMYHYCTVAVKIPSVGDIPLYPATISHSCACLKIRASYNNSYPTQYSTLYTTVIAHFIKLGSIPGKVSGEWLHFYV